jgi:hypothetical protein
MDIKVSSFFVQTSVDEIAETCKMMLHGFEAMKQYQQKEALTEK